MTELGHFRYDQNVLASLDETRKLGVIISTDMFCGAVRQLSDSSPCELFFFQMERHIISPLREIHIAKLITF